MKFLLKLVSGFFLAWLMIESVSFAALILIDLKNGLNIQQSFQNQIENIEKSSFKPIPFGNYDPLVQYFPLANYTNELSWNKNGFIDNESEDNDLKIFPEKKENIFRIILLGGSSAASLTGGLGEKLTDPKNTIASLLESKLNDINLKNKNLKFQVLNFAQVSGWSGNSLSRFTNYLSHIEPDMIIEYSGYNDAAIGYGMPYINWSSPAKYIYFKTNFPEFNLNEKQIQPSKIFPFSIALLNNILFPKVTQDVIDKMVLSKEKSNPLPKVITNYVKDNIESKLSLYSHNINILASACASMNLYFLHFLQPYSINLMRSYSKNNELNLKKISTNMTKYSKEIEILESKYKSSKNIRFFDKTEIFQKNEEKFFIKDGYHLTENGNERIAEIFFVNIQKVLF